MNSKFQIKNIFLVAGLGCLLLGMTLPTGAQTPASITVNGASTITSFVPIHIFGNNMAYWVSSATNSAVAAKVQAAGNYFLRYPGGSSSDDYHWNGSGSFDANHYWVPSGTSYAIGWQGCAVYRGTTSTSYAYPSNIDDGNTATTWMSNIDTDLPDHQWVYIDLGATGTAVSSVSIVWGNPYATSFEVQYDNANAAPYTSATETIWTNTSAGTVAGTGGTQVVSFTSVSTRYIRILMTASSGGAGAPYAIAELSLFNGATQYVKNASPPNTQANQYNVTASSMDPASSQTCASTNPEQPLAPSYSTPSFDFNTYMTEVSSFSPKGIPLITVNVGTGTPSEAASWVHYANAVKSYGIHYWQIGNETNGNWETGGPMNANDYGRRFIEYYNAMQAEASSDGVPITIVGPVSGSPNAASNAYDSNSYIQDFLLRLYNNPGGNAIADLGGMDFHWYPGLTAFPAGFSTPGQLANFPVTLGNWLSAVGLSLSSIPVLMSEYNSNANAVASNATVQEANGLWLADWLGAFIKGFGSTGFSNLWDVINGGSDHTVATDGDLGYLDNSSPYQQHATYWAMQMMATDWAIQGDSSTHELVNTTSSAATLVSYADYRPDGVLSLMVVNEDSTNSYATTLNIGPFVPNTTANSWTFNTTNYVWQTTTTPYNANPDTAPTTALLTGVSTSFPVTFSPSSINVIQFTNSGIPTSTPTGTPSATATKTPTNTPSATLTGTPTSSPTNSPTATLTGTPTNSSTATSSGTPTNSQTNSPTPTLTGTPTDSPTATSSPTPSATPTLTVTNTVCMDGFGNTCTYTPTPLATVTPTNTPTNSPTATVTVTFTPTPVTVQASQGSSPPNGSTQGQGAVGVPVQQIQLTNPGGNSVTLSSLTLTESGTSPTGITSVSLVSNGTVISTASFSGSAATFNFTDTIPPSNGAVTYQVVANFSNSAPIGSYSFSITGGAGTNGQAVLFANMPVAGATIAIAMMTATPSNTPTSSPTVTDTPTSSSTPTSTPAITGVFPNPFTGGGLLKLSYQVPETTDEVKVKVFTLAFRKIFEDDNLETSPGGHLYTFYWGLNSLDAANGLYYVVLDIKTGDSRTQQVMKLLVIR